MTQNLNHQDGVDKRRAQILDRIAAAARSVGRDPDSITLTAVSKKQPDVRVDAALTAGQRVFGENRVQEAHTRWRERRALFADLELRLVGPLQSNKAEAATSCFDVIETLDREKLARALAAAMEKTGASPRLFVQINTGEEAQKAGVPPLEADEFISSMRQSFQFEIEGLMCIPPIDEEPALHFALLADIAKRNGVPKLSMGMSSDFETAIRHGATHVRVGSALFGERPG